MTGNKNDWNTPTFPIIFPVISPSAPSLLSLRGRHVQEWSTFTGTRVSAGHRAGAVRNGDVPNYHHLGYHHPIINFSKSKFYHHYFPVLLFPSFLFAVNFVHTACVPVTWRRSPEAETG